MTLLKAKERLEDNKLWEQWLHFAQLEYSFDEFKNIQKPKVRTSKEIMSDVYGYIEMFNNGTTRIQ